jgi:hypothetical protein
MTPRDSAEIEAIRSRSKTVFGGLYRVEVSMAILEADGAFFVKDLADDMGLDYPLVYSEVRKLLRAGLLRALPKVKGHQARYLEPMESVYWDLIPGLIAEWKAMGRRKVRG